MKILIIGATHGNELLGVKLYERLLRQRSTLLESIDFIIGNPRAFARGVRYTQADMNRSYGIASDSYEAYRAKEIQKYILATKPDLVLDMHTTNCVQPSCLIVHDLDGKIKKRLLRASHIDTILRVHPMGDVVSLGNNVVGYEVSNHSISTQLLDDIVCDLERFIVGDTLHAKKNIYTMLDKIYKRDVTLAQSKTFINFQKHELGYVPIMTGNNSYKRQTDYLGFKASEEVEITV